MDKEFNIDLINTLKNYNDNQIYLLLNNKKFISPDIIYILYKYNYNNLFLGLVKYIQRILLLNDLYKKWINEINNTENIDELKTYIKEFSYELAENMLKEGGAIHELINKTNQKFKYSKDSIIDNLLKNHLTTDEYNITIPLCPIDKSLGKNYPLFSIGKNNEGILTEYESVGGEIISDNKSIKFFVKFDDDGRCLSVYPIKYKTIDPYEIVDFDDYIDYNYELDNPLINNIKINKIKDENNIYYVHSNTHNYLVQIDNKELDAIKSKKLGFFIDHDGALYLRCTFINKIPNLSSFISYRGILKEMSKKIEEYRKTMQFDINNKILKEFEHLKNKNETRKLLPVEKNRFEKLQDYINKKKSQKITTIRDEKKDNNEQKSKDIFEQYAYKEYEKEKNDIINDINIDKIIKENYNNDEIKLIDKIKNNNETKQIIINAIKHINNHYKINDKKKKKDWDYTYLNLSESLLNNIANILIKNESINTKKAMECTVCGSIQDNNICNYTSKLIDRIYNIYKKSDDYNIFLNSIKNILHKNSIIHIEKSDVLNVIEELFNEEVKNINDFIKIINKNLYLSKQKILYGNTMIETTIIDNNDEKINDIKSKIKHILDKASSIYIDLDIEDIDDITLLDILSIYFE